MLMQAHVAHEVAQQSSTTVTNAAQCVAGLCAHACLLFVPAHAQEPWKVALVVQYVLGAALPPQDQAGNVVSDICPVVEWGCLMGWSRAEDQRGAPCACNGSRCSAVRGPTRRGDAANGVPMHWGGHTMVGGSIHAAGPRRPGAEVHLARVKGLEAQQAMMKGYCKLSSMQGKPCSGTHVSSSVACTCEGAQHRGETTHPSLPPNGSQLLI